MDNVFALSKKKNMNRHIIITNEQPNERTMDVKTPDRRERYVIPRRDTPNENADVQTHRTRV